MGTSNGRFRGIGNFLLGFTGNLRWGGCGLDEALARRN